MLSGQYEEHDESSMANSNGYVIDRENRVL
jgi:hypothetical protein